MPNTLVALGPECAGGMSQAGAGHKEEAALLDRSGLRKDESDQRESGKSWTYCAEKQN